MQCPACAHENGPDAKFCSNCGARLELACPACSAPYQDGDRFCSQCGTSLTGGAAPPASAGSGPDAPTEADLARYVPEELLRKIRAARSGQTMRGERRTVTMLFADIQGSTAAAENLDPEEWADIMNGAFGHLIAPIYRYEGTLARLQGDAILAFFGAPIAHEDDPVRAAHAALEILSEIDPYRAEVANQFGVEIAVRVGINTGLVVVGEVGSDLRVEYTALGDAINVAARMEQTADPGTVRVTHETATLLGGEFDTEVIGPVEVKGKSEPVTAVRVLGVTRGGVPTATTGPLVGRRSERDALDAMVQRLADGRGGLALLIGEAGIGKSRLLAAMQDSASDVAAVATAADAEADLGWMRGNTMSYEHAVPFALFVDLLSQWWGGTPTADDGFGRIAAAWERATGSPDPDAVGFLAALVGAGLPAAQQRLVDGVSAPVRLERTTKAVVQYLAAEATRRPLLVVLDDVHWADSMSLVLVEQLMEATETAPLGLVVVMRPVRDQAPWRLVEVAQRDHGHRTTTLEMEALDASTTQQLLDELVGDTAVGPEVRAEILERANGNPLFVEEIVRSLQEADRPSDAQAVRVPASLTGLLTARLDGLDEPSRHVAQVSSVIGRQFSRSTLEAVADDVADLDSPLSDLLRRGILHESGRPPDVTYAFRHPLIHETAYSTVLLKTRRRLHSRIADLLATDQPAAVEQIANHYVAAGEREKAFPHLVHAGERAVRSMALSDAFAAFTTALESLPVDADPDLVLAAHSGLGEAYSLVPDLTNAAGTYQSLLDYGRESREPRIEVAALNRLGFSTAALAGDFEGALGYLDQARSLAEDVGDDMGLAEYHMNACFVRSMQGDPGAAAEHDAETARIGAAAGDDNIRLTGLLRRSLNLVVTSRFEEAMEAVEPALELARELGDEEAAAVMRSSVLGFVRLREGDLTGARDVIRESLQTVDRFESYYGSTCHFFMAMCADLAGDVELALSEYGAMERYGRRLGQSWAVASSLAARARLLVESGVDGAGDLVDEAVEQVTAVGGDFNGTAVWVDLALVSLAADDLDTAAQHLERARQGSSALDQWERPRQQFVFTRLALEAADVVGARAHLEQARSLVTTGGLRVREPMLLLLDGTVAVAEQRMTEAAMLLDHAAATAAEMGRRPVAFEALVRLAEVHDDRQETATAAQTRDRAASLGREMAGLAADPALHAALRRIADVAKVDDVARDT